MQQKRRSPREMASRAYDYFRRGEREGRRLTIEGICRYTGYKPDTLLGHISKKYSKRFLYGNKTDGYTVRGLIGVITREEFIRMHRQTVDRVLPNAAMECATCCRILPGTVEYDFVIVVLIVAGILWK